MALTLAYSAVSVKTTDMSCSSDALSASLTTKPRDLSSSLIYWRHCNLLSTFFNLVWSTDSCGIGCFIIILALWRQYLSITSIIWTSNYYYYFKSVLTADFPGEPGSASSSFSTISRRHQQGLMIWGSGRMPFLPPNNKQLHYTK